jgi:hypothetical protein
MGRLEFRLCGLGKKVGMCRLPVIWVADGGGLGMVRVTILCGLWGISGGLVDS